MGNDSIVWPRGFIINGPSGLDEDESVNVADRPFRAIRLSGRQSSKEAFVAFAKTAGRLLALCPEGINEEVPPESASCLGSYRWVYTVFDLALSQLEGSGLRVEGNEVGGRFVHKSAKWGTAPEPVLADWDHCNWYATIENMWVASEFAIQELLLRLDCVEKDGNGAIDHTPPTPSPWPALEILIQSV
jgi:hypothetical protein